MKDHAVSRQLCSLALHFLEGCLQNRQQALPTATLL